MLHRVASEHHVAVLALGARDECPVARDGSHCLLTNGRAASGTTDEVVRSDVLSALYGHHVDVLKLHGRVLVVTEPGQDDAEIPEHPTLDRELSRVHFVFEPGFFSSSPVHIALVVGAVSAMVSAIVGVFTVMRGQSFAGHALTDVATTGGSGAFFYQLQPAGGIS